MKACSGYLKRVIKFKEEGNYRFQLTPSLTNGQISAQVQTKPAGKILSLDSVNNNGILGVKQGERYYLIVRLKKASGSYELTWSLLETINGTVNF